MIRINWNPLPYVGPVPINWYGLTYVLGFLVGGWLVWRRAATFAPLRANLERLMLWIIVGSVLGARLYYILQNNPTEYFNHPWRMLAIWEGGLAYFGGLVGGITAAFLYLRKNGLPFLRVADVFGPAIALGSAIGRIACGLDGMDYGTPTALPWGVVYTNPNSYGPNDGLARHPDQFYELAGDLLIAAVLVRLRAKLPDGAVFLLYLLLFSVLRFFVFFARGNVAPVVFGLKNAQITALIIFLGAASALFRVILHARRAQPVSE